MLSAICAVIGGYAAVSATLVVKRVLKITDLHEEYTFIRSREQKSHIRAHALVLRGGFKSDLLWIKSLPGKVKTALDWLKTV
jgi:hypothetical protein